MQVNCDWSHHWDKGEIERELSSPGKPFKFQGPGLYLTKTDTLLIVPLIDDEKHPLLRPSLWKQGMKPGPNQWPENQQYEVCCWNTTLDRTILAAGSIPTRLDTRDEE